MVVGYSFTVYLLWLVYALASDRAITIQKQRTVRGIGDEFQGYSPPLIWAAGQTPSLQLKPYDS